MKKIIILLSIFVMFSSISYSQEIGVRLGDVTGGNIAVDGIISVASWSRIHADVSFGNSGVGVDLLWDFIYKPLSGEAFKWYAGVGPFLDIQDPFGLGVIGELGLDYHFNNVPISISADWRPAFRFVENTDLSLGGFGLNIRYVIK